MEHCALDLGGRKSQVCIRSSDGTILKETRCATLELGQMLALRPPSRVVMETCAEAFGIADAALALGHEVRVVPATLVRALGVGARRTKTDVRDARVLSEASCRINLPSVHIPSARSREWKTICGMRVAVVTTRTKLINNVRGWLRGQAIPMRKGGTTTFPQRLREQMPKIPLFVQSMLRMIDSLSREIEVFDGQIALLAKDEPLCVRLMSVPGIGPATAVRFVATIDRIDRFPDAHSVESYLGLVPGEASSSEKQQRLSITKAGSPRMRWLLVQAAWSLRARCRSNAARPLQLWALEVEKRRGKRIATVALARKLTGILYALWRDGTTYEARPTTDAR